MDVYEDLIPPHEFPAKRNKYKVSGDSRGIMESRASRIVGKGYRSIRGIRLLSC